jgi:hypothetical protein
VPVWQSGSLTAATIIRAVGGGCHSHSTHPLAVGQTLAHFDVEVGKLIFEYQACSHCILEASMYRVSSTIDLDDKVLTREIALRCGPIFHETPHQSPPLHVRPKERISDWVAFWQKRSVKAVTAQ